jgi:hypothetical protein
MDHSSDPLSWKCVIVMMPMTFVNGRILTHPRYVLSLPSISMTKSGFTMSDSEPQGCLVAILRLFSIRLSDSLQSSDQLPYRQRDDFLSAAELSFYRVLTLALDGSYLVCPKVNLADIFFVARPNENQSYRNRIDRKHVDFLLCELTSMKPILGIELDDSSHARRDRHDRDQFVDKIFKAAGLPLLRVRAAAEYSPQNIADLIRQAIAGRADLVKPVAHEDRTPICPKCGTKMVLRKSKRGDLKGDEFWGCGNYPKCRETVPM